MANAVSYKWKWVGFSPKYIHPITICQASHFYDSKDACLSSAYMNVPFIDIMNPWTRVDLIVIRDNAQTGEITEVYMFTSYLDQ